MIRACRWFRVFIQFLQEFSKINEPSLFPLGSGKLLFNTQKSKARSGVYPELAEGLRSELQSSNYLNSDSPHKPPNQGRLIFIIPLQNSHCHE